MHRSMHDAAHCNMPLLQPLYPAARSVRPIGTNAVPFLCNLYWAMHSPFSRGGPPECLGIWVVRRVSVQGPHIKEHPGADRNLIHAQHCRLPALPRLRTQHPVARQFQLTAA